MVVPKIVTQAVVVVLVLVYSLQLMVHQQQVFMAAVAAVIVHILLEMLHPYMMVAAVADF
jgi:hypothetical protein